MTRRIPPSSPAHAAPGSHAAAPASLVPPYGGALPDLVLPDDDRRRAARAKAFGARSVVLDERAACDLELLATGAYAPLRGYMGREDVLRVLAEQRLADGTLWPVPISLALPEPAREGEVLALRDPEGLLRAVLTVEEAFDVDPAAEARALFGPHADEHPLRGALLARGPHRARGALEVLGRADPGPFARWHRTPAEVRATLAELGGGEVVAFQTRNPMHRAHEWMARTAQEETGGLLLLHPTVGPSLPDDVPALVRVRAVEALARARFDPARTVFATLPLPMWMAGPREALLHAIVRRNHGASRLVVGRDHAGPGRTRSGAPFFPPQASRDAVAAHAAETGVEPVAFDEVVHLPDEDRYERQERVPRGANARSPSGTEVRAILARGEPLPAWVTRPEVAEVLAAASPRTGRGVCVWFTGLPAAGKSTLARLLAARYEAGGRPATVLDGDVVRTVLSKGLGFSRADRDANIARIAFVAAEVVRHGGVAIVAAVSPFEAAREAARTSVGRDRFVLVHVDTPLAACEARDPKGLYAAARAGSARGVTGVDDPYEKPVAPDAVLDGASGAPDALLERLLSVLGARGLPRPEPAA